MSKEKLLEKVVREETYSEDEMAEILAEMQALNIPDAYEVLTQINDKGGDAQKDLMIFLSEDENLYEGIQAHVKSLKGDEEEDESVEEAEEE